MLWYNWHYSSQPKLGCVSLELCFFLCVLFFKFLCKLSHVLAWWFIFIRSSLRLLSTAPWLRALASGVFDFFRRFFCLGWCANCAAHLAHCQGGGCKDRARGRRQAPTSTTKHQQAPTSTNQHQQPPTTTPTTRNNQQQQPTTTNNHQQQQATSNNHQQPQTTTNNHKQPQASTNNKQRATNNKQQIATSKNNKRQQQRTKNERQTATKVRKTNNNNK